MCFCTSRQSQAQREELRELTAPVAQIFSGLTSLSIVNSETEDVVFELHPGQDSLTTEQLQGYIRAHQSACEIAQLYKEKNCPIMHMEQNKTLVSIYQILPHLLLIFTSTVTQDIMLADNKMKPHLQRLIDALEGRDDK